MGFFQRALDPVVLDVQQTIAGNEAADEEAKKAAMDPKNSSPPSRLPKLFRTKLPISSSAAKRVYLEEIHRHHNAAWRKSKRRLKFKSFDKGTPKEASKRFAKIADSLPRKIASLLVQLRTGHAPLNQHLHNIQSVDSPKCPNCDYARETVEHFLIRCPAFTTHRNAMIRAASSKGSRPTLQTLLTDPNQIPHTFRFIAATQRFETTWGKMPSIKAPQNPSDARSHGKQTAQPSNLRTTADGRLITIPAC